MYVLICVCVTFVSMFHITVIASAFMYLYSSSLLKVLCVFIFHFEYYCIVYIHIGSSFLFEVEL